jgi:hypothetical protein
LIAFSWEQPWLVRISSGGCFVCSSRTLYLFMNHLLCVLMNFLVCE